MCQIRCLGQIRCLACPVSVAWRGARPRTLILELQDSLMPLKPVTRQVPLVNGCPSSPGPLRPPAAPSLRTVATLYLRCCCGTIKELIFIKDSQLLKRALQKYKWVIITTTVINESKLLRECKVCNERRGKERGKKKTLHVFELEIFPL